MKNNKNINNTDGLKNNQYKLRFIVLKSFTLLYLIIALSGCSDFVEIDPPKNKLVSATVFEDASTVKSALANLYYSMREEGVVSGYYGLTPKMGIYSDELDYFGSNSNLSEFYQNRLSSHNTDILTWWSQAFKVIYSANDIIKGLEDSSGLDEIEKNKYMGQALFVRAYLHSILVSLFGDIPYITTTDYTLNNKVSRMPEKDVYDAIIADLLNAEMLLGNTDLANDERVIADQFVVKALLARMYLYTGQWKEAESMSNELIDVFNLEADLDKVFLKGSVETIWQLKSGQSPRNTQEASQMIILFVPGQTYALTERLLAAFEEGDERKDAWVSSISDTENKVVLYYAHKYKARLTVTESLEHSIQFRLAEQYLIRAESRLQLGNLIGAAEDLNSIRNRAGLSNVMATEKDTLLEAILSERRVELFTEQGHRWFDLKRTGRANDVLGAFKPNWIATKVLLPIPEVELEMNPNLLPQNQGY